MNSFKLPAPIQRPPLTPLSLELRVKACTQPTPNRTLRDFNSVGASIVAMSGNSPAVAEAVNALFNIMSVQQQTFVELEKELRRLQYVETLYLREQRQQQENFNYYVQEEGQ